MQNWTSTLARHRSAEVMFFVLESWQPCFIVRKRAAWVDLRTAVIGWFKPNARLELYFDVNFTLTVFRFSSPVQAWSQAAPRSILPRRSPSRRRIWSASGSLTPASSSFSPAGRAQSAPHALPAHTYSAHRSSCGNRSAEGCWVDRLDTANPTQRFRIWGGGEIREGICTAPYWKIKLTLQYLTFLRYILWLE